MSSEAEVDLSGSFSATHLANGAAADVAAAAVHSSLHQLRRATAPAIVLYGQTGSGKSHALRVLLESYALLPSMRCMLVVDRQKGDLCAMACPDLSILVDGANSDAEERLLRWMGEVDVRIWSATKPGLTLTLNPFPLTRFRHRIKHTLQQERGLSSAALEATLASPASVEYDLYVKKWSVAAMEIAQRVLSLSDAYPKAFIPKIQQPAFANKNSMDGENLKVRLGNLIVRIGLHPQLCDQLSTVAELRQYLSQTVGVDQICDKIAERFPPLDVHGQPAAAASVAASGSAAAAACAAASSSAQGLARANHPISTFDALIRERHRQEEALEVAFLFQVLQQFTIRMGACDKPVRLPWTDDAANDEGPARSAVAPAAAGAADPAAAGPAAVPAPSFFFIGATDDHVFPIECDSFVRPRLGFKRVLNIIQFPELQQRHATEAELITHQLFHCTEAMLKQIRGGRQGYPSMLLCLDEAAYTKKLQRSMLDSLLTVLATGRSFGCVTMLATQDVLGLPPTLRNHGLRLVGRVAVDKEERRKEIRRMLECSWKPKKLDEVLSKARKYTFHVAAGGGEKAGAPFTCAFREQLLTYNEARFSTHQRDLYSFIQDYTARYLDHAAAHT